VVLCVRRKEKKRLFKLIGGKATGFAFAIEKEINAKDAKDALYQIEASLAFSFYKIDPKNIGVKMLLKLEINSNAHRYQYPPK